MKIDLAKAYDRVDWRFLQQTLVDFGFPMIIVSLIMSCVTSSRLSILWNGSRLPYFKPKRGLRQGDPFHLIYLCFVWRNYPCSSLAGFAPNFGNLFRFQVMVHRFPISYLQMMCYFSPMRRLAVAGLCCILDSSFVLARECKLMSKSPKPSSPLMLSAGIKRL